MRAMKYSAVAAAAIFSVLVCSGAPVGAASLLDKAQGILGKIGGGTGTSSGAAALGEAEIGRGLKEALKVGAGKVVSKLGVADGFNLDPTAHIPLPASLKTAQEFLSKFGYSSLTDDLELRLNRAAEAAVPEAQSLFVDAISQMTLDDVRAIYDGPDDAATRFFQNKMSKPLSQRMVPIVDKSLSQVGAIASYDAVMGQYRTIPYVPNLKANLTGHVIEKALVGLFHYIAKEEAAIRNMAAARTTDLLKRVFTR